MKHLQSLELLFPYLFGHSLRALFLRISALCIITAVQAQVRPQVSIDIRYACEPAEEVFLIWGINGWKLHEDHGSPPMTQVVEGSMKTKMTKSRHGFSAKISVPQNTMIDYYFLITRGPFNSTIGIRDRNRSPFVDYHTLALHDNIIIVEPAVRIIPKEPLSLTDFALPLCLGFMASLLVTFVVSRRFFRTMVFSPASLVLAGGLTLLLFLVLLRATVAGLSWDLYFNTAAFLPLLLWCSFYDVVYALILTLSFLTLVALCGRYPRVQYALAAGFGVIAVLSLVLSLINLRTRELTGDALDLSLLKYYTLLPGKEYPGSALTRHSGMLILAALLCTASTVLLVRLFSLRRLVARAGIVLLCFCGGVYFVYAPGRPETRSEDNVNPVVAFIRSCNPFAPDRSLFTLRVADSLSMQENRPASVFAVAAQSTAVRNVIIFMMDSTPVSWLKMYGSACNATPEMNRYAAKGLVFRNIYAPATSAHASFKTLLCSSYPLTWKRGSQIEWSDEASTLSAELGRHGFHCAFFSSAAEPVPQGSRIQAGGPQLAADVKSWLNKNKSGRFFMVLKAASPAPPRIRRYSRSDTLLNKRLSALAGTDALFGQMMTLLGREKLLEKTLVVLLSSQGYASPSGQDECDLSEDLLRLPCVFMYPGISRNCQAKVGGLIDLAPTILKLTGFSCPPAWRGEDLFSPDRKERVYFSSASGRYFGFREGNFKFTYDEKKKKAAMYDLESDPAGANDLAHLLPLELDLNRQRLAAWLQELDRKPAAPVIKNDSQIASK